MRAREQIILKSMKPLVHLILSAVQKNTDNEHGRAFR